MLKHWLGQKKKKKKKKVGGISSSLYRGKNAAKCCSFGLGYSFMVALESYSS